MRYLLSAMIDVDHWVQTEFDRVSEGTSDVVDRSGGHAGVEEQIDDVADRHGGQLFLDPFDHLAAVSDP